MEVPFVGRNDFLSQLKIQYSVNKIIIVHGLKSIGKTRTVLEFINRVRENVTHLEEINIRLTDGNIQRAIFLGLRLATLLRVVISNSSEWDENITQIIDAFNNKNNVEYIIHIDNSEHIFDGPICMRRNFKKFCCQLVKETHNVHIIISSSVFTNDFGEDAFISELQPLSISESSELLQSFMTDREKDVAKVAELCLGLPLALIMVGAELTENSLEEITEFLLYSRIQALSSEFYPAKDRVDFNYGSLVKRLAPELRDHLAALQYIPGSFHQHQALQIIGGDGGSVDSTTFSSLNSLRKHHILSLESASQPRFNIHGILRDCIKMFLVIKDIPEVRKRFCKAYSAVMRDISSRMDSTEYVEAITLFSLEYPNLQKLLQEVTYATSDTFRVFIDLVTSSADLLHNFMGGESVAFYQQCLNLIPLYGTKKDEATVKWGLGEVLTFEKGALLRGEESYKHALTLINDTPLCSLHVQFRSSFGLCLWRAGKQSNAISELHHALDDASYLGMRNEPIITTCIRNLARAHAYFNFQDGEKYHKEALKRAIEYYGGENNASVAESFNSIGICYQGQGKNEIAMEYFQKALELKRKLKVPTAALVLTMNNVAMRYSFNGRKAEACRLLQDALILLERSNSQNTYTRLATFENYGCLQQSLHNYEAALPYINEVISVRSLHSPLSPNIFEMFELKGLNCMHYKRYSEAAFSFKQVTEMKHIIFEQRPLNLLVYFCFIRLLECYACLGNKDEFLQTCTETQAELLRLKIEKDGTNTLLLDSIRSLECRFWTTLDRLKPVIREWSINIHDHVDYQSSDSSEWCETDTFISAREQTLKT